MRSVLFIACFMSAASSGQTFAQGRTAVRPLDGFSCMSLNLTPAQVRDYSLVVPIYAEPTASSRKIGEASAIIIVRSPYEVRGGFQKVLFFNGEMGWLETKWLSPFPTKESPKARCTPMLMSDGKPGFDVKAN